MGLQDWNSGKANGTNKYHNEIYLQESVADVVQTVKVLNTCLLIYKCEHAWLILQMHGQDDSPVSGSQMQTVAIQQLLKNNYS